MEQKKEYYAFISYKREDEKWAQWLQDKLEHYKFPTNLNGRTDLPRNIRPTFRDVTDLNPGLLAEEIDNALRNSEWLIVVCSPRSAKSPWVCKEAQTFIDLGRADRIIPFVIEGYPFSNDTTTECYPEALLNLTDSKELLAANINEMGRDAAAIKVVARMFNLRFDALWQRHEREQRRKKWIWIGGSILFALLGLGIAGYYVTLNQTIARQNEKLQNDSIIMVKHIIRIQGDSIKLSAKNDSIAYQNKLILSQRDSLYLSNKLLIEERNKVLQANKKTNIQYARFVAKKAHELIENNDYFAARKILLEVLPEHNGSYGFPYVPEVEYELRRSLEKQSGVIKTNIDSYGFKSLLSPDGNFMVIWKSRNNHIEVLNAHNGRILFNIPKEGKHPSIKFFPTGELFVSGDRMVKVWDLNCQKEKYSYPAKDIGSAMGTDIEHRVITIKDKKINVINGYTGKIICSLNNNIPQIITSAIFIPTDKIVTSSMDDSIRIWDLKEKKVIKQWKAHEYGVDFVRSNNTGTKLISRACGGLFTLDKGFISDDYVRIWDVKTGKQINAIKANDACFSPDDSRIIIVRASDVLIIDANNGSILKTLKGHKNKIHHVEVGNNSKMIVSRNNDEIRIWDENLIEIPIKKGSIYSYPNAFYPDDRKFLIVTDTFMLFNSNPTRLVKKFAEERPYRVTSLVLNKQGDKIITTEGIVRIRDSQTFSTLCKILVFKPKYAELSPDDNTALTIRDNNIIQIWKVSFKGEDIRKSIGTLSVGSKKNKVNGARFSPDGRKIVAASSDGIIRIFDAYTSQCIDSLVDHKSAVNSIAYSEDGKFIVSASDDRTVKIWDVAKRQCKLTLEGHFGKVYSATFSKDAKKIVSTSSDYTMRIWDSETGQELKTYLSQGTTAAISNNGHMFLVIHKKGQFKLYDYPPFEKIIEDVKLWAKELSK